MFLFSPAVGGRGRLALAVTASVLMHALALTDRWGAAILPPTSIWAGANSETGRLTVLLQARQFHDLPSRDGTELQVLSGLEQQVTQPSKYSDERLSEARGVPGLEEYLTRERLSSSAEPLSDIHIPWPAGLPTMGLNSAVFTLFIDELGKVRDVVPDAHTLSPVMELVARNAFLEADFRPARLNGRAVKSMKRIEVEFEFLPVPEPQRMPEIVGSKELSQ